MSRTIFDEPALLDETLISLTEACKHFRGKKRSRPTVERYVRRGSRGAILESVFFCGERYTSVEAIDRFIRNQLRTEPDKRALQRSMPKKDIAAASRKFGLPEPE